MNNLSDQLKSIAELYSNQDRSRTIAYTRAYRSVLDFETAHGRSPTAEEAAGLKFIGDSILKDIRDFYRIGEIPRLKFLESQEPEKLRRSTVDIFRDKLSKLYDDFAIAGSYRRGAEFMSDIDIVIQTEDSMESVMNVLNANFDIATIVSGHNFFRGWIFLEQDGRKAWRLDIITAKPESWATSLLYFTGPVNFNIRMRTRARDLGLKLNRYTLESRDGKTILPVKSEHDIFEYLGLEFIPPENRDEPLKPKSISAIVTDGIVFNSSILEFIPPGATIAIAPDMVHEYPRLKQMYPDAKFVRV